MKPQLLNDHLEWLTSGEAHAAGELGYELGTRDKNGDFIEVILNTALTRPDRAFARGYSAGASKYPRVAKAVVSWMDKNQTHFPEAVAYVATSGGRWVGGIDRVLQMFDKGCIPSTFLYDINFETGGHELEPAEYIALLERLARAAIAGDHTAIRVALDSASRRLDYEPSDEANKFLVDNPRIPALLWSVLEAAPDDKAPESNWWATVVANLARLEPARAAKFAARVLGATSFRDRDDVLRIVRALLPKHANAVMDELGAVMLDEKIGWKFFIGDFFRHLFSDPGRRKTQMGGKGGCRSG